MIEKKVEVRVVQEKQYAINVPWIFSCVLVFFLCVEAISEYSFMTTDNEIATAALAAVLCLIGSFLEAYFVDMDWRKRGGR